MRQFASVLTSLRIANYTKTNRKTLFEQNLKKTLVKQPNASLLMLPTPKTAQRIKLNIVL